MTKNAPAKMTLPITARGIVTSGRFASAPNAVALSNPTKLKTANAMASPTLPIPPGKAPCRRNWFMSSEGPCACSTIATTRQMIVTETTSSTSMTMAETCTPR